MVLGDIVQCPYCGWSLVFDKVCFCTHCGKKYAGSQDYIDFIDTSNVCTVAQKALVTWGENLHDFNDTDSEHAEHFNQFLEHFGNDFDFPAHTRIVDIGCGGGKDSLQLALKMSDIQILALDIGSNVMKLAERYRGIRNLKFIRADARCLPIKEATFDCAVSFGVFHHTDAPEKCFQEVYRVLKQGGVSFVYLYKNHEDNLVKRLGVFAEEFIMKQLAGMPHNRAKIVCHALAYPSLLLFSWPAWVMKKIPGLGSIANSFPMHWGTNPSSVCGDLEDRLLAPVNHRYSRRDFISFFKDVGFSDVKVVTASGGHYAMARKME